MRKHWALNSIFFVLAGVVLFPAAQQQFQWIKSVGLHGMVKTDTALSELTVKSWFNDSFQQTAGNYVTNTIGLRSDFIRLHNLIEFSLFENTNAEVVIGKNHNLHGRSYIDAYLGRDYMGDKKIRTDLQKVKYVQNALNRAGKKLLIVYAPSKSRYAPQDIPDSFFHIKNEKTNLEEMVRVGDSLGVKQLDVISWYKSISKPKHLLFARSGIHWTYYGATLVADSIQKFMKREGIYMPAMSWEEKEEQLPEDQEWDMEQILNLPYRINTDEKFFHPEIRFVHDSGKRKPGIIYLGDSFVWTWLYCGVPQNEASSYQYWSYYNDVRGSFDPYACKSITEIDPMKEMMNADCIILLYTETNLKFVGNGFMDDAYRYFRNR